MRYACKICIATKGLKGSDVAQLPQSEGELIKHMLDAHGMVVLATDMLSEHVLKFELDDNAFQLLGFEFVPGYPTPFVRRQAPNAIPNGSRVMKTAVERGDTRKVGARGVILGSIYHPELGLAYFVEWDESPKIAVFIVAKKITRSA